MKANDEAVVRQVAGPALATVQANHWDGAMTGSSCFHCLQLLVLTELLTAIRAKDAQGFREWLGKAFDTLGVSAVEELFREYLLPLRLGVGRNFLSQSAGI